MAKSGQNGSVNVTVAVAVSPPGVHRTRHVEARLSPRQAEAMRRMYDGLRLGHHQLDDGRHVDSAADVVRWILERAADDLGISR